MSWTDSQIESLITFYSSVLVSGARNFATGVKNWRQKPTQVFWRQFLERVSLALHVCPNAKTARKPYHERSKDEAVWNGATMTIIVHIIQVDRPCG